VTCGSVVSSSLNLTECASQSVPLTSRRDWFCLVAARVSGFGLQSEGVSFERNLYQARQTVRALANTVLPDKKHPPPPKKTQPSTLRRGAGASAAACDRSMVSVWSNRTAVSCVWCANPQPSTLHTEQFQARPRQAVFSEEGALLAFPEAGAQRLAQERARVVPQEGVCLHALPQEGGES